METLPPRAASANLVRAQQGRWVRIATLVLMVGAIAVAHYTTAPDKVIYHDIFRRSVYVPIVLGAVWFGTTGGVVVALTAAVLYTPHMFFQLQLTRSEETDHLVEMLLYVVVGGLTGLLVEREKLQRQRTEQTLTRLQGAHDELQRQATQLTEVQEALTQAERLSTLGELAADLAHEIRNPLATMRGTVQILAANPPENDKREFAELVMKEIDRLDGVVEGYLRSGRAGAARTGHCDAVAALDSAVALTRRQAERNGVTIERLGADHLPISMDLGQATQVFMNLVLNAIQAMPEGGVLRIEWRLLLAQDSQGGCAEIAFADTGPGVAAEDREKVFRAFFTTRASGTGLGLSIARRLVEAHGGTLTLDAECRSGSTFRARLPLADA